jgi:hypothetical protein
VVYPADGLLLVTDVIFNVVVVPAICVARTFLKTVGIFYPNDNTIPSAISVA